MSSLSDALLRLSSLNKNSPFTPAEFRLDRQLERVILAMEPQWASKNIGMTARLEPCAVTADEGLLFQVWTNLLANAIKFTPAGGRVRVSLHGTRVSVEDTGPGVPEDEKRRYLSGSTNQTDPVTETPGETGWGPPSSKRSWSCTAFPSLRATPFLAALCSGSDGPGRAAVRTGARIQKKTRDLNESC